MTLRLILAALLLPALAMPAMAQEGCTQASPCAWYVLVDNTGFDTRSENRTVGDWVILDVTNLDEVLHTVTIEEFGIELRLEADANGQSAPFELNAVGAFTLHDEPTGANATLNVVACNPDEFEAGTCTPDGDSATPTTSAGASPRNPPATTGGRAPGVAVVLLLAGLAGLAMLRRRD